MPRKGFTLVELLVVIAIIGLLSTVAVISLGSARTKSRNTKRITDIRALIVAFNMGRDASAAGTNPSSGGDVWICISSTCYAGWLGYARVTAVDDFLAPFLPNKVVDPNETSRGRGGYLYDGAWPGGPSGAGAYIDYAMEGTSLDCGPGKLWFTGSNYYECMIKVE